MQGASAFLWLYYQLTQLRETDFTDSKHVRIILYRRFLLFFYSTFKVYLTFLVLVNTNCILMIEI